MSNKLPPKIIRLGTGLKTSADFVDAIHGAGGKVCDFAEEVLNNEAFGVAAEQTEVNIEIISEGETDFLRNARFKNIWELEDACSQIVKTSNLELCSLEVGPRLRLGYMNQPKDECLVIAMKPIEVTSRAVPCMFRLQYRGFGRPWLCTLGGDSPYPWRNPIKLVFIKPR